MRLSMDQRERGDGRSSTTGPPGVEPAPGRILPRQSVRGWNDDPRDDDPVAIEVLPMYLVQAGPELPSGEPGDPFNGELQ